MRLPKGSIGVLWGFVLGLVAATIYWYWQMPIRSERLMMTEIVGILKFSAIMAALWIVGYYVVPFIVRFAFMEQFEFKHERAPYGRRDWARLGLIQPYVNQQLAKYAVILDECYARERAIAERANSNRDITDQLLDQMNAAKAQTGGAEWNFNYSRILAGFVGVRVWDTYRDYLPSGRVWREAVPA